MSPTAYQPGDFRDTEIEVHRAAAIGEFHVPTFSIIGGKEWEDPDPEESLEDLAARFDAEAQQIADTLIVSLPGGTLDRLIGRLLTYKASHLIVNYDLQPAIEKAEGRS